MRILLSGCSGQLGRALAARLPDIGSLTALPRHEFDLASERTMRAALDEVRPELIVNAAAYTAVDRAEEESELAFAVNATAPGIMAEWAARHDAAILHYSTDYVFDGAAARPYREDDPTNPINVYGNSKLAGELAVRRAGAAHLIIRTSWLYDAEGSNFLRTILRLARERPTLRIVDDQTGAPTPAWWLAEASTEIIAAGDANFTGDRAGVLHAATAGATTWHGFADAVVAGARARSVDLKAETIAPIPSSEYPTLAARPSSSVFELNRLRQRFGIAPPHWRDALAPVLDQACEVEPR